MAITATTVTSADGAEILFHLPVRPYGDKWYVPISPPMPTHPHREPAKDPLASANAFPSFIEGQSTVLWWSDLFLVPYVYRWTWLWAGWYPGLG